MNSKPPVEEIENIEGSTVSSEMIIGLVGLLFILIVIVFISKNSNSNAQFLRQQESDVEQQVDADEVTNDQQEDSETSSSGLLARAKKI